MKKIKLNNLNGTLYVNPSLSRVDNLKQVTLTLDEEEGNLTDEKAKHLLRRITFGPTPKEVDLIKDILITF